MTTATLTSGDIQAQAMMRLARMRYARQQAQAMGGPGVLGSQASLYQFVLDYPWQIDHHPFDWEKHKYQIPIYEAFRLAPGQNDGLSMTVIKGAQVGMTIWAMLGLLYTIARFRGQKVGYFMPDQTMSQISSSDRFKPLMDSNPEVTRQFGALGMAKGADNSKRLRSLGESSIFFSYMGGMTSTESVPLTAIFYDEVRMMASADISRAEQRISHAAYPVNIKLSTAGAPGVDIDYYYKLTDQREWVTQCQCADGIMLADAWPECLGFAGDIVFYRCPRCDTKITNPQDGQYVAQVPSKTTIGFRVPQLLSLAPLHQPSALWAKFNNPMEDRGEFYRSVLGRPFIDPEAQLVSEADLAACENREVAWEQDGTNCAMGIDAMGGWLDIVVLAHSRGGKYRLVHLERLESDSPFEDGRLDALMRRYDVDVCCCDLNPAYNESLRFAKRWQPRVFLVTYSSSERADMIAWRDRLRKKDQIANEDDVKFKYLVCIQRYKAIDWAMSLYKKRLIELPPREGLVREVRDELGRTRPVALCAELYWPHMQRVVRQKHILDEQQGTYKMEIVKVGHDPHFAFSYTYAAVAASREPGGRVAFI